MRIPFLVPFTAGILAGLGPAASGATAQATPLFSSDEVVSLTLRAPLEQVFRHRRGDAEEYPATLEVRDGEGTALMDLQLRTRGKSRLSKAICPFPPLRLKFRKKSLPGTLFEGQDRLKLVTHCRDDDDGEQRLLLEALAYRIYNQITDYGFRIRLARITYEDTGPRREPVTRYGFLIEDVSEVAERTGWIPLSIPAVPPDAVDPENLARLGLFQYMIGNTDWSAFQADEGSAACCHNTRPVGGPTGPVFVVPYDFDITGLVDPPYADRLYRGNLESLGLRRVRERRFRGGCRSQALWPAAVALFDERRPAIEETVRALEGLTPQARDRALDYLAGFYDVIDDPSRFRREIQGHCRTY